MSKYENMSDDDLILRIDQGDQKARDELIKRYGEHFNIADYGLILKARQGDQKAQGRLIELYEGLFHKILFNCAKAFFGSIPQAMEECQDLYQQFYADHLLKGFKKLLQRYDPKKGSWKTYLHPKLISHAYGLLKKYPRFLKLYQEEEVIDKKNDSLDFQGEDSRVLLKELRHVHETYFRVLVRRFFNQGFDDRKPEYKGVLFKQKTGSKQRFFKYLKFKMSDLDKKVQDLFLETLSSFVSLPQSTEFKRMPRGHSPHDCELKNVSEEVLYQIQIPQKVTYKNLAQDPELCLMNITETSPLMKMKVAQAQPLMKALKSEMEARKNLELDFVNPMIKRGSKNRWTITDGERTWQIRRKTFKEFAFSLSPEELEESLKSKILPKKLEDTDITLDDLDLLRKKKRSKTEDFVLEFSEDEQEFQEFSVFEKMKEEEYFALYGPLLFPFQSKDQEKLKRAENRINQQYIRGLRLYESLRTLRENLDKEFKDFSSYQSSEIPEA